MNLIKKIKQKIVDEAMLEMLKKYQSGHWAQILTDENLEDWEIGFERIGVDLGNLPHKNKPTKDLTLKDIDDCSNKLEDIKC